jgi:CHAD domain-containing protein
MLSPAEVGWDLTLYAQEWLEERFRLTLKLTADVKRKPTQRVVHDLRVACRRLREAIEFFRGVSEVPPLPDVDRAARRMARSVGRLRETDVAIKRLTRLDVPSSSVDTDRSKRKLLVLLREKRKAIAKKRKDKIAKRATKLEAAIKDHLPLRVNPRSTEADPAREAQLRALVEARVAQRRSEVERLFEATKRRKSRVIANNTESDVLHGVRVAIKHWRYASEIARAVMPRVLYRPMAAKLRHLQDLGGNSQDYADLTRVVEEELAGADKLKGARFLVAAARHARVHTALQFFEALKVLLPSGAAEEAG